MSRRPNAGNGHEVRLPRNNRPQLEHLEGRALLAAFTPVTGFPGPGFAEQTFSGGPPDATVAASPTNLLFAADGQLQLTGRDGSNPISINLTSGSGAFFGGVDQAHPGLTASQPSVLYDAYAQRFWVIVAEASGSTTAQYVDIAVSDAYGPTTLDSSSWHFYSINVQHDFGSGAANGDLIRLAADYQYLYLTGNYYLGSAFQGVGVIRLDKSLMINGQPINPNPTVTPAGNNAFSLQPVQSIGLPFGTPQLFVDADNVNHSGIRVWTMNQAGTLSLATTLSAPFTPYTSAQGTQGIPQAGSTTYVNSVGSQLINAVYRNGAIWAVNTVLVNGQAAVAWYQINALNAYPLLQSGTITAGTGLNAFDPSVAVDASGDVGITYTVSGSGQDPTVMFTGRQAADLPGTMETPAVVQTSPGPITENTFTQNGQAIARWGRFEGIAADPGSSSTFWTHSEYVAAPTSSTQWGTVRAEFTFAPVAVGLHVASYSPVLNSNLTSDPATIVVTFNHWLQGFAPNDPGAGMANNPRAITLSPWGPDHTSDAADIPVNGLLSYTANADGTSQITLTPKVILSTDDYTITASASLTDEAGSPLSNSNGNPGNQYSSFQIRIPQSNTPGPQVTSVTANNGAVVVSNNRVPLFDALAIGFSKAMDIKTINTSTVTLIQYDQSSQTSQNVPSVVAYNPGTETAYLVPTQLLSTASNIVYYLRVDPSVDDNTSFPSPGTLLTVPGQPPGTAYETSFTVSGSPPASGSPPLEVARQNGAMVMSPAPGTNTTTATGYVTATMSETIDPTSLGTYSFTLTPQSGGINPSAFDAGDLPVNAVVGFNPNTNQLVLVPTVPLGSDIYLYTLNLPMTSASGDPLADPSGVPLYESFQLSVSGIHASAIGRGGTETVGGTRASVGSLGSSLASAVPTRPPARSASIILGAVTRTADRVLVPQSRPAGTRSLAERW